MIRSFALAAIVAATAIAVPAIAAGPVDTAIAGSTRQIVVTPSAIKAVRASITCQCVVEG